jgi:hypothetical protein
MIGRLRQIVPVWSLMTMAILFALFEGPVLYMEWQLGRPIVELKIRPGTALILLAAAYYGIHRAVALHPFYQREYGKWLERTPWTVEKPLPLGPIELVWEDGFVLGGLILLHLTQPFPHSIRVLNMFLIAHLLALSLPLFATGVAAIGYLVVFGVGLAVRLWPSPLACLTVLAAVYVVAYEGLWRSLARFPWQPWAWGEAVLARMMTQKVVESSCGWPHDRILRDIEDARRIRLNRLDALLVSMLVGFWLFCGQSLIAGQRDKLALPGFFLSLVPIVAGARLSDYVTGYAPPISLWGRICTGRWIVPGYDKIFVAPLVSLLTLPAVLGSSIAVGLPLEIAMPAAVAAAVATALLIPPRLEDWRLTGKYRMHRGFTAVTNANFVKVG